MNIESIVLEKTFSDFSNEFSKYFDWNDIDLTFFSVDIKKKEYYISSSNYEWQLLCWADDLDLLISERLKSSIQYWSNYSDAYAETLKKTEKNQLKIDICSRYDDIFEITTINAKKQFSLSEILAIYKYRPIIADYSHYTWKKNPEIALPMRANINDDNGLLGKTKNLADEFINTHKHMRFGNIRFTRKEMITIRLLLSHCRVKEISYIQGCSEASENKRIQNIKEKLGCPYVSSSGLFTALKEQGITLACLETLIDLPLTNSIMKNK